MSINEIDTTVLLFPSEEWSNTADDAALTPIVRTLLPNVSFTQHNDDNLVTLSTHNADRDGTISGFLYVPDLRWNDECYNLSKGYVPGNVTRQANLPPTDFTLVAIAPWISKRCTYEYLNSASLDPVRGLLLYLPNDTSTEPPPGDSPVWDLGDDGAWRSHYNFPTYALPQSLGTLLMHQLSLYSGNMTRVPYGHDLSEIPGIDPRDYVRLYTQLRVSQVTALPSFWVFLVVVLAVLVAILVVISTSMHLIQSRRRKSLRQRVQRGEVNLEALGIKRLTIPTSLIERLPLFTYSSEVDESDCPLPLHLCEEKMTPVKTRDALTTTSPPKELSSTTPQRSTYVYIQDNSTSNHDSLLIHKFLPYSQPTCAICLHDFESGITEIRELPCGHIFHPGCIDLLLARSSSLCPICKKSALPMGFCPVKITNAMVSRERNLRRLRSQITVADVREIQPGKRIELGHGPKSGLTGSITFSSLAPLLSHRSPTQPEPAFMTTALPEQKTSSPLSRTDVFISRQES